MRIKLILTLSYYYCLLYCSSIKVCDSIVSRVLYTH